MKTCVPNKALLFPKCCTGLFATMAPDVRGSEPRANICSEVCHVVQSFLQRRTNLTHTAAFLMPGKKIYVNVTNQK